MGAMTTRFLQWGIATRPRPGETVSGDRFLVQPGHPGVLLAVVDGAGHGPEAARAAMRATDVLERSADLPLAELLRLCHLGLAGTRGAVLLAASYDASDATLTWAGVGDAFGVLVRADARMRPGIEALLPRGGILGVTLPALARSMLAVHDGDLLVLATDGVRNDFVDEVRAAEDPQRVAVRILERHGKGSDDALVLAARFRVEAR
jgi:negative regulator of sigma-B (phosphoserine phosphatase)